MIIEIIVFGAAVLFALGDSRTGWKRTKKAVNFIRGKFDQVMEGTLTPGQKVENLLDACRIRVEKLREGAARLEANSTQSREIAEKEEANAKKGRELARIAMNKGLEEESEEAMIFAVNAEERAALYRNNSVQCHELFLSMKLELANAEGELEVIKTQADTIKVHAEVAETNRNLYELISEVSKEGATPVGKLKELAEQTERDAIASTIKIQLARNSPEAQRRKFKQLIQGSAVEEELEKLRTQKLLTEGKSEEKES